ncbi:glycoside hydrolase family 6 protein [Chengkuizengella sp. SCS-71B]|uniref:glycoside hydrolase family 6 protein n=1 Tax=Chengkuizengella sp. SCS-71B TaxID=3115290 RepID=UPI0032C21535
MSYKKLCSKNIILMLTILLILSLLTGIIPKSTSIVYGEAHVDNPFEGATSYVNPDYAELIDSSIALVNDSDLASRMETIKSYPTAVWLDRIAAIHGGDVNNGRKSLADHLDIALAQKQGDTPITATIVIYDLPGRDCAALASNGELPLSEEGLQRYKTEYIDPIVSVFSDPKYQDIRIVTVIEPDGLPNLVTNLSDPECAEANSSGIQVEATQYALNQLHPIDNVYIYMDIAHSGWLGWDNNLQGVVSLYTDVVQNTTAGLQSIDGFITNTSNYTPLEEPYLTNPNLNIGGQPLRSSNFYEWNPNFDEVDFTEALYNAFVASGFPQDIGFIIDTSRNGWGGDDRPTEASGDTVNSYVDSGRIDLREHRGLWCNVDGAGMGLPPQVASGEFENTHLDAFVWVKPPGESDGASEFIDNDEGKNPDPNCDPEYTDGANAGVPTGAMPDAPIAGHWFHNQFVMLVENAYPAIPPADNTAPNAPNGLTAIADDGVIGLSWSSVIGADSYNLKRSATSGGPYTTIGNNLTNTNYSDTGLTNGSTYYYVVSAVNDIGESANSSEVSAIPNPPPAPGSFTLTAEAGNGNVDLSWTISSNAISYDVKRSETQSGPFTSIASALTANTYNDTNVVNGTTYYYVITANNSSGSTDSNTVSAAPQLPLPGSFTLNTQASNETVNLSWSVSSFADSYSVGRSTSSNGSYTTIATGLTSTAYSDTGLTNGTTYYYVVTAENGSGTTDSNTVSATPQLPSDLKLQYKAADTNAADNQFKPHFNMVNTGNSSVPLSELTIRYYYTADGNQSFEFHCDYAVVGCGNVSGAHVQMSNPAENADHYLEISFSAGAGNLAAGGQSGEIQARNNKSDWSNLNELNDYSYNGNLTDFTEWNQVTLYQNGALISGVEPGGGNPTPPAAPSGLTASAGDGQVDLSWSSVSGADSYNVKRSTSAGGTYTTVATGVTSTNYTNAGLTNGTTYYYVVSAQNTAGESANSTEASATPQSSVTIPGSPTGLTASAGDGQVDLSWSSVSGADSYNVKRSTSAGGTYTTVATGVTSTNYTNAGLTNGTTYYYVVSAQNTAGESANSTEASATPQSSVTIPGSPTGLTASAGDGQVDLSWSSVSGADSYNVKRSTSAGGTYTTVATGVTSTNYTNAGLTNGTTYYYVVSAQNTAGESANSTEASATPSGGGTASDLVVQYKAADTNATNNQFKPHFNIVNNGNADVALNELTIRYYYTIDSNQAQQFHCDYAVVGCGNINGTHVAMSQSTADADHYIEVSFTAGAGTLAAGGQSGEIQTRNNKTNWSNYNENNDYSFNASMTAFTDWNKVTLHQNGQLVWGIEP